MTKTIALHLAEQNEAEGRIDTADELRRLNAVREALLDVVNEMFSLDEALIRDIYGSEFVTKAHAAVAGAHP